MIILSIPKIFQVFVFSLVLVSYCSFAIPIKADLQVSEVNGIDIAWAELGNPKGTPLVMVMGLGSSHKVWSQELIDLLIAQDLRIILLDNRDSGDSERFEDEPVLWWNLLKHELGFSVTTEYTLNDMAADVIGVMDLLQLESAHILGVSMGGMISQLVAAKYPERTRSLISVMSSSGAAHLPPPDEAESNNIKDIADSEPDAARKLQDRGFYPSAIPRQLMAILDSGDRTTVLTNIKAQTLVIHGEQDKLIPIAHGKHTAEVIPDAKFVAFEGMQHNIPEAVRIDFVDEVSQHIKKVEIFKANKKLAQ